MIVGLRKPAVALFQRAASDILTVSATSGAQRIPPGSGSTPLPGTGPYWKL